MLLVYAATMKNHLQFGLSICENYKKYAYVEYFGEIICNSNCRPRCGARLCDDVATPLSGTRIAWVAAVTAVGAGAAKGAKHTKSIICLCNCLNTLSNEIFLERGSRIIGKVRKLKLNILFDS